MNALLDMRDSGTDLGLDALETFVSTYPDSRWTPSVRGNLAAHYRKIGRYSAALDHWEAAWPAVRFEAAERGKLVKGYVIAEWMSLLSSLGRVSKMKELVDHVGDGGLDSTTVRRS